MDIQSYYPVYAPHLVDVAEKGCRKAFPTLFFVLAAVRKGGKNQRNGLCPCLLNSVYCNEKGHYVVIYRESDGVFSAVHFNKLVVFCILKDVNVFAPDRIHKFCLDFSVGKPGKGCVDFKIRCPVPVDCPPHHQVRSNKVVAEVDVLNQFIFVQTVSF